MGIRIGRLGAYLCFLSFLAGTCAVVQGAQKYAVVVGIAKYQDHGMPWLQFADHDADLFKTYLIRLGIPLSNVTVVKDEFASTAAIRENIRHVLVDQANAGDDVYVFLSARGIATNYYRGGFILSYMSRLDHPISTALSTEDLQQLVQQTKANLYVFADLDRDPPGPQLQNTIQLAMKSVWQVHPEMAALLASIPGQRSLENKALDGGHGVFAYYLVKNLRSRPIGDARGEVNLETLFRELQNELAQSTGGKQSPYELPPERGAGSPGRRSGDWRLQDRILVPAMYRMRSSDTDEVHGELERPSRSWEEFSAFARRSRPEELIAAFRAGTASEREEMRGWYEVGLEDKGERLFVRYGDCDECVDDADRLTRKDYVELQRSFELAETLAPDERLRRMLQAKRQFGEGRILTLDGKYTDAELELTNAIQAFPTMPELHSALGTAHLEQGRYAEAIAAFQKAVDEAQDWSFARHNLAVAYIRSRNYGAAERVYREAIDRTPYEPSLYLNLGMLLTQLHRMNDAEQEYEQALQVAKAQQHEALKRQAAWKARENDLLAAAEAHMETSRHRTFVLQAAEVHNAFGALRRSQGKLEAARRELAEAVRLNPQLVNAEYQLATVNYSMANDEPDSREAYAAIEGWRRTLEEQPGYLPAHLRLAEAYEDQGNFKRAGEEYDAVLKTVNSPAIRALRAQAFGDAGIDGGNQQVACQLYREAEGEIATADSAGQYGDMLALQNFFFEVAARANSAGSEYVKADDFSFQPCRWNHELLPNVRLDARRFLFLKLDKYCVNKRTDPEPVSNPYPVPMPVGGARPACVNCGGGQAPEPGTFWLAGVAIGAVVLIRTTQRRRRKNPHRF